MIIKEKISNKHNMVHIIFNDKPKTPKTFSSYLLLVNYYQDRDITFQEENDWRYYFIVRRHFLRKKRKENGGHWKCHYCGKIMTKMQKRNTKWQQPWCVTVDHVVPKSNPDCDILDTSNMVESCHKCNNKKGTIPYDEFIKMVKH